MEKYKIKSLYSDMIKNIKKKPYQVLRGTKNLALSNPKYHSFYKSTTDLLQTKTFKLPNETDYPKLVKSKYISIKKKITTFSYDTRNKRKRVISKPNSAKVYLKNSFVDQFNKKKNINFFVGEKYLKRNLNISTPKYHNYSQIQNKNNIKEYDYNIFSPYTIKNSEKRVKDFFMLLNSIFYDEDYYYDDLKYNEKEIFGHKEEYLSYLKDEFNYFLKKEKEFDIKSDLLQLFMTKKYGKIELFLKSARIDVIDESYKKDDAKLISINIPFHLMCLLYLCNGEQIYIIIILILKKFGFEKLNDLIENVIILSDEDKKKIFLQIIDLVNFEKDKIILKIHQKNYERYYSQLKFLETIRDITDMVKYNNFLSNFFKDHNRIKIIDNSNTSIYNTPNYKSNNKINFETNLNKYSLNVICLQKIYKVYLYMPEIVLIFNDYYKQINHFIDKELFLFLYQNNFMYWDFYILHYLFSYKNFRKFMSNILSVKSQNSKQLIKKNNNYFRSKAKPTNKDKDNTGSNNNYYLIQDKKFQIKTYVKYHLNELYSYEMNINENCYEFSFLFSNNVNLSLYKLKSYILFTFFTNINKPTIYEFYFNFYQMKILYFISLFENLTTFLKRLLYIKNDSIHLDYSYFDSFSTMSNKEILQYFHDLYNMSEETKFKALGHLDNQNTLNSITLRVCEPFIEVDDYNIKTENKIVQSNIKLRSDIIYDLINIDVNMYDWINKLNEYKHEFDFKYHVKYEETRNKKIRRQITTGNKNRDLHKVFNKFLKIS